VGAGGDAGEHLSAIARAPRPAGGDEESRARRYCAGVLEARGFSVAEEPFAYSAFPGRWATPLAGVASIVALLVAATIGARGMGAAAEMVLIAAIGVITLAAWWLATSGVLALGALRERSTNLVATRGDGVPRVWLVAHLDSKSQPVPMLLRAGGITLASLAWLAAIALALVEWRVGGAAGTWRDAWIIVAGAGVLASIPIAATTVGSRSAGALDDASGVATVLAAAALVPRTQPLGVVLTSAEELGLAGARAWVRGRAGGIAVNVDGVDDEGAIVAMYSGVRPVRLLDSLARASSTSGIGSSARRLLPGVLTDGVALAQGGWQAVTLSKGTWRTLSRIHRPADTVDALTGAGAEEVARLIAQVVPLLSDIEREVPNR
jgi:hypothetical protein